MTNDNEDKCQFISIHVSKLPDDLSDKLFTAIADVVYGFEYPDGIDPYMYAQLEPKAKCIIFHIDDDE
jgi:hypothetical protein